MASNITEEDVPFKVTMPQPSSQGQVPFVSKDDLDAEFEARLQTPLDLSTLMSLRRQLAHYILTITGATPIPQPQGAKVYIDSLDSPATPYCISQESAHQILGMDDQGHFIPPASEEEAAAMHRVVRFKDVFFKQDGKASLSPGMEFAMYSFYGLLGGQILAPSCLMVLRDVESPLPLDHKFFLQASQGIAGPSLKRCLEYLQQNQQPLPLLVAANLSHFLTASWLSSPSDYKPDNMIVFAQKNGAYLVGIDNDLALNDPIVRPHKDSYQHVLGIKQILFSAPSLTA